MGRSNGTASNGRLYRPRAYYLVIGVICTVFFSTIGVASTLAAIWNIDGSFARPVLTAVIFGVCWSAFTLLGVWIILAYLRERLILEQDRITQYGVIRTKAVGLHEITHVRWRTWPVGGSIVIRSLDHPLTFDLASFTDSERNEIVMFFREDVNHDLQEGWPEFERERSRRSIASAQSSRGRVLAVGLSLFGFAKLFACCWLLGLGTQYLVLAVINVATAFWYLWRLKHRTAET